MPESISTNFILNNWEIYVDLFLPIKKKKCIKGPKKSLSFYLDYFHYKEDILEFSGSSSQVWLKRRADVCEETEMHSFTCSSLLWRLSPLTASPCAQPCCCVHVSPKQQQASEGFKKYIFVFPGINDTLLCLSNEFYIAYFKLEH